jgi:pimeloyl-ACP methyl ester carboxylesterase
MSLKTVSVQRNLTCSAEAVWAVARQFRCAWHPAIEWVKAERNANGHLLRNFKVHGEVELYRERLTYFSDTSMELHYTHVEGIKDVLTYDATLKVAARGEACVVMWEAAFEAPESRASAIAAGTKTIFELGIDALFESSSLKDILIGAEPELAVTQSANKPGPLVLFVHGIGGNKHNWQRQLQSAALQFQCAALDLRGYGASALGELQSTVDDHCNDILRVMAAFGKTHVVLCGMSLGSWIATSFAMRHSDKLAGLILSGGCTGLSEASQDERDAFLSARQKPLDEGQLPADFAGAVIDKIAGPETSEATKLEMKISMAAIPTATYRDALWCFTHPAETFDFGRINCPVLMLTGEFDRMASPSEIRGVAQRIHQTALNPDIQFEVITGAGHICNVEKPDRYNQLLSGFLRRLARSGKWAQN